MTNEQRFKTAEERHEGFKSFCKGKSCEHCPCKGKIHGLIHKCPFEWLDLEYEEYEEELNPCPFCGCKKISTLVLHGDERKLRCTECGSQTEVFIDKKAMIDSWNRRV